MKTHHLSFGLVLLLFMSPSTLNANTIYFPQVVVGGGWSTTFVIMNTGTTNISAPINFYDQNGVIRSAFSTTINIPPGGSTRVKLPDSGPLTIYWGEFAAGLGSVQGVATFDLRLGALVTTAGVLGTEAGNSFLLPLDVTPLSVTGVAIANANAGSSMNVGLRLVGENGSQIAAATIPLGPRMQTAKLITELFPQFAGTTLKGTLFLDAPSGAPSNSIVATGLTVSEGLLSALPVIPPGLPIFQSDSIRFTVGQLVVLSDNSRAQLSATIENTTNAPLYFAFPFSGCCNVLANLSDNRATSWYSPDVFGIKTVNSGYTYSQLTQADFTTVGPSERITVIMNFSRASGGNTPGTTFGFTLQGRYYTATGFKDVSIGFPEIRVGQQTVQAPPSASPVLQSDSIRFTIGQLSVVSNNSRAQLTATIENTTSGPLYLAFPFSGCCDVLANLSDNRATSWYSPDVFGIKTVNSGYTYSQLTPASFTTIGPAERITVIMAFTRASGGNTPGTTFGFTVQGRYYTPTGFKDVSIGFPAIIPAVTP